MKVVRWTDDEEDLPCNVLGGLGGWFGSANDPKTDRIRWNAGHRWKDYLENLVPEAQPYAEGLRAEVLRLKLKAGGDWHQREEGVLVFEDGTCSSFSWRAWGDIMAAIWSEEENIDHSYMDFYMRDPTWGE